MPRMNKAKEMNIKPGKISYKILQWMQEHQISLKNTTAHHIASRIAALPDVENGELTIEQTFGKMVKCNIVYKDHHEKSLLSDFRINYWHKSIPAEILADAPVEVKRAMAKTIDDMKDNQYMDEEGAVVTPNAVEKCEDPFNEDGWAKDEEDDGTVTYTHVDDNGANIEHIAWGKIKKAVEPWMKPEDKTEDPFNEDNVNFSWADAHAITNIDYNKMLDKQLPDEEKPTTQKVSVPLDIKKDGKQITVNLSLTINL